MSYQIVTVSTHRPAQWYYTYDQFFQTCADRQPLVLDTNFAYYSGLGSKPKMLYKAIKEGLIKTKHLLFIDCWDSFFSKHPDMFYSKFLNCFDAPIVISAEKNCFPADTKEQYDALNPPTSYKYLNSGMIAGETEAILAALEAMELHNVPDDYRDANGQMVHINDQALWQELFLKQPVEMVLDYKQALCQTLHDVSIDAFEFDKYGIKNIETGSYPYLFHANGSAKDSGVKEPIMKQLGLI